MDNFHFIDIKPSIDRKETALIKDVILKRAKEKAETLTEEKNENYTTQVQHDVMDIARESLNPSSMNPFNQFMENMGVQNKYIESTDALDRVKSKSELEMPRQEEVAPKELKRNIESVSNQTYSETVKDETMKAARSQFKSTLSETLNFLNTQAAIKMVKGTHSKIR